MTELIQINTGFRQSCPPFTDFISLVYKLNYYRMERRGGKTNQNFKKYRRYDNLFLDDQVTVADSEDAVQISVHKMETVTCKHGLKISKSKKKICLLKEKIQ